MNTKIYRNVFNEYAKNIWGILGFVPMAEKDTFKPTKTARKPMTIC